MDPTHETAAGWLSLFERFGVSLVMLGLFVYATGYVIYRLFNPKTGILTNYGKTVEASHDRLTSSYERLEKTDAEMAKLLKGHTAQLDGIQVHVINTDGKVDGLTEHGASQDEINKTVMQICMHACDIISVHSKELDDHLQEEVEPSLEKIRELIKNHI